MVGGRLNLWQARAVTLSVLVAAVVGLVLLHAHVGAWVILPAVVWSCADSWCRTRYNGFSWDLLCRWLQKEPEKES